MPRPPRVALAGLVTALALLGPRASGAPGAGIEEAFREEARAAQAELGGLSEAFWAALARLQDRARAAGSISGSAFALTGSLRTAADFPAAKLGEMNAFELYEAAAAHVEAVRKRAASIRHLPPNVRGWMGDWTGVMPQARPPTAWDYAKGINVRWHVRLGSSISTPVVVGDRVITTVNPCFVLCCDKHTGRLLWRRETNVLELIDKARWEESKGLYAVYEKAWADAAALADTWDDRIAHLMKTQGRTHDQALASILQMRRDVRDKHNDWWGFVTKHAKGAVGRMPWGDFVGHAAPTPVTDGRCVWVRNATGVTACFDLDGNRRWMVRTEYASLGTYNFSSPLLVGGKLLQEVCFAEKRPGLESTRLTLAALDAATGRELAHQRRCALKAGEYPLLARIAMKGFPREQFCLDVQFVESPDVRSDVKGYYAAIGSAEPYLQRVVKLKPDSQAAARAKALLAALEQ